MEEPPAKKRSREESDDEEFDEPSPNKRLCVEDNRLSQSLEGHDDEIDDKNIENKVPNMTPSESSCESGLLIEESSNSNSKLDDNSTNQSTIDNQVLDNAVHVENAGDQNGNVDQGTLDNDLDSADDDLDPDDEDLDRSDPGNDSDLDPEDSDDLSSPDVHVGPEFEFQWPHSPSDVDQLPLRNWEESVCNPLYRKVSTGNISAVRELLAKGHDPNQAYYYDGLFDYSALHRAVLLFRPPMVQVRKRGVINSLAPGRFEWNFWSSYFQANISIDDWGISCEIAPCDCHWTSLMINQH